MASKRKNLKLPGRCIFCGSGRLSKEHFWPTWASPILPRGRENAYRELKLTVTEKTRITKRELRERQGDVSTKKIRVVCRDCNSGWMGTLEDQARPILEPLMAGNPSVLTLDQQRVLLEWITLKVMVGEQNVPADAVFTQAERDAFRITRTIPERLTVWIAKHRTSGWHAAYYKHAATLSLSPTPPLSAIGGRKNVQTTAFGIGALYVYAMVSDPGGVNLNDFISIQNIPRLWPTSSDRLSWGWISLGGNVPGHLAMALDKVASAPTTLWKPLPSS
jgi:hypothetical protein